MKSLLAKLCSFMLFLTCTFLASAQQGNVTAGGDIGGSGGTMSYSVGQVGYHTYTSVEGSISFGLQQPWFDSADDELPPFLDVPGTTIGDGESLCFNATGTVILGGSGKEFVVEAGGHADVIAGERILMKYGTRIEAGGSLHARISTDWCYPGEDRYMHPLAAMPDEAMPPDSPPAAPAHESLHDPLALDSRFSFKVYPNPGNGMFTIELRGTDTEIPKTILIYSLIGELIAKIENQAGPEITINIMHAKPGIYMARVQYEHVIVTGKIIKH